MSIRVFPSNLDCMPTEPIIYFLNDDQANPKAMDAIVLRERKTGKYGALTHRVNIIIPNDAVTGIDLPNIGRDTAQVVFDASQGTQIRCRVTRLIKSNDGYWQLELHK